MKIKYFMALLCLFIVTTFSGCMSKNDIKISTVYLPEENEMFLDCGELSLITRPLLYPSLNNLDLKVKEVSENIVSIEVNDEAMIKDIVDSFHTIARTTFEENYKNDNIVGFKEYQMFASDTISGISYDDKYIYFEIYDKIDWTFFSSPLILSNNKWKITEYNEQQNFVMSDEKETIIVEKSNDTVNSDIFFSNDKKEIKNYNIKEVPIYDTSINFVNFSKTDYEILANIIDGKNVNHEFDTINFWTNSNYENAVLTNKIKEHFSNNNINLNVDYCEPFHIDNLIENNQKFMFLMDDYVANSENVLSKSIDTKNIYVYYKKNCTNFIDRVIDFE